MWLVHACVDGHLGHRRFQVSLVFVPRGREVSGKEFLEESLPWFPLRALKIIRHRGRPSIKTLVEAVSSPVHHAAAFHQIT